MTAFWIAVVVGIAVSVTYISLGIQAFLKVRKDVLALAATGETADLDLEILDDADAGGFAWKALGAVVVSTAVITLLGVSPVFWYLPAVLAVGSALAVVAAFLIDRRSAV